MITSSAWFLQAHGEAANAAGGDGTVLHLGGGLQGMFAASLGREHPNGHFSLPPEGFLSLCSLK